MQFCTFLLLDGDPMEGSLPASLDVLSLIGESSPAIVTLVLCILYSALPSRREIGRKDKIAFRLLSSLLVIAIGALFFCIVQILSCEGVGGIDLEWAALPVGVLILLYGYLIWKVSSTSPQICVVVGLLSASSFCVLNWVGREVVATRAVRYALPAQLFFCSVTVTFLPHYTPNARPAASSVSFSDPFSKRDRCDPEVSSICWVDAPSRGGLPPPKSALVL